MAIKSAKKDKQIREYDLEIAKRDLSIAVIKTFYNIILNKKLLAVYKDAENNQKQYLVTSKHYYSIGRGRLIDVYQGETQLAMISPKIVQTENEVKSSGYQLANLLRVTDLPRINVVGRLTEVDHSIINNTIAEKKSVRPELTSQNLQIEKFGYDKYGELTSNFPKLDLLGDIGRTSTSKSDLNSGYATSWSVGVQLTIPLFSGFSLIPERNVLKAKEMQLEHQKTKLLSQISLEEIDSYTSFNYAETVLTAAKKAANFSKKALDEALKDFGRQAISSFQYIVVNQNFLDAQSNFLMAQYNYLISLINYFVASGVPVSELVTILDNITTDGES